MGPQRGPWAPDNRIKGPSCGPGQAAGGDGGLGEAAGGEAAGGGAAGGSAARGGRRLEVVASAGRALVQDLGRPGHAASGVGRSGAADRAALRLVNRLLANPPDAAAVEVTLGGLTLRAGADLAAPLTVALAGAPAPADVDGMPVGHHALVTLRAGQSLRLGPPTAGLRSYVGVRGGIVVAAVLGSRSTDTLALLGPDPLAAGEVLPVGPEPPGVPLLDVAPVATPAAGTVTLRAVTGPRAGHLAETAALAATTWTVSEHSDRVGMRLRGGRLGHAGGGELPSEGMVRGGVQVPPGGEPVLFLADHPVTGGYPVVAVVLDADVDRAAQLRPGQQVRFRLVPPP
ncbi:MAG: biotin-dependent carboxyltransferase family protein [Pseudonocardia sp.]